jgi:hypothetical protein
MAQGLKFNRVKGLCVDNVASFSMNLKELYMKNMNMFHHMCGTMMKVGHKLDVHKEEKSWPKEVCVKSVHIVIPNVREWLSMLVCVNAICTYIPNFYNL